MRTLAKVLLPLLLVTTAYAHDDGHGPKLGDQPKFGGLVTAVIDYADVEKGRKAKLLYKAELTKNSQGLIRVYFYDNDMKPVNIDGFAKAEANLLYKEPKAKKWTSKKFSLTKKKDHFEGELPLKPRPPFNVDVIIEHKKDQKLFMAFDNLS